MAYLTNFSFEFFYEIFTADASLRLLYHGAKKSKMTKNSKSRGSCLNDNYLVTCDLKNTKIRCDNSSSYAWAKSIFFHKKVFRQVYPRILNLQCEKRVHKTFCSKEFVPITVQRSWSYLNILCSVWFISAAL